MSHYCVTLCHGLEKIYGMLILHSRPLLSLAPNYRDSLPPFFLACLLFLIAPNYRDSLPIFFLSRPPFFARSQLPRESPLFFLARPPFSLAPNYRESLPFFSSLTRFTERVPQLFFLAHPHFFVRPQLPRESPPFFPRSPAFFVRPQLPRAWNRLSENLQRSCLFSTQCLRIEKSVILEFDRDQYYVLPK